MSSNLNVLQVIPKLGYGGAETGCYDSAHFLPENNCKSYIVTNTGSPTSCQQTYDCHLLTFMVLFN